MNSVLENCAYFGSVNIFNFLLTNSDRKITPKCLRNAIIGGNTDIINECMREFQIDNECLNCAIGSHNNKFVEYILDHDLAELNKIDFDTIYYSQNVKALFLLYEKDPNSIIPWCTAFPQTIDILKSGNINLSTIKQQLQTLFDYSVKYSCNEITQFLLESPEAGQINVNYRDKSKKSALDYAAELNNKKMAEILLNHGAEINPQKSEQPPLYHSIIHRHIDMSEFLLSFGANANAFYDSEQPILCFAIAIHCQSIAEILISHGAELAGRNGELALETAVKFKNIEMVQFLIFHGVEIKGSGGGFALYEAIKNGYFDIAQMLISNGADPKEDWGYEPNINIATKYNHKEIVELLISYGVNLNSISHPGQTSLHYAIKHNYEEIAEILIKNGADLNIRDSYDQTALHFASISNMQEIIKLLISHGADVNLKDSKGKTAFDYLLGSEINKECIEAFISHGANLHAKDS